jgi:transposase-like protein
MTDETKRICPYCKEDKIQKVGKYASVTKGKQQRYKCSECGRTFY